MMPENAAGDITVTSFELLAKPALHVPPPAKQIALIRAHEPPVHFYRYLLTLLADTEIAHARAGWKDDAVGEIIRDPRIELYVLHVEGVPAGMGELDLRQLPEARIACSEISAEFADPPLRRYLLAQMIALAWSHDIKRLTADVTSRDRQGALSLFQSCGFSVCDQRAVDSG